MKKLAILVVFFFSLVSQSLAQGVTHLVYNHHTLFFSRWFETESGKPVGSESVAWELVVIAVIILILIFQFIFTPHPHGGNIKFYWSHFLPGICFILVMIAYIFGFSSTAYVLLGTIAALAILFLSLGINFEANWTFGKYLIIQVLNLIVIALTIAAITHSWLAILGIFVGPVVIFGLFTSSALRSQ